MLQAQIENNSVKASAQAAKLTDPRLMEIRSNRESERLFVDALA
jgi:hypothetical protein